MTYITIEMKKKTIAFISICILLSFDALAQAPPIQWQKTFGGSADELLFDIIETADGGYIAVGRSSSGTSGDKTESNRGGSDIWVVKMDALGNKQWDKTIGATSNDHPGNVIQTADGGYIIGGFVSGAGGDRTAPVKGGVDYWLIKLNATGTAIQWQAAYGGSTTNQGYTCVAARSGGYYLSGFSNSGVSGDKSEASKGAFDIWVVKTDALGNMTWNKTLGGSDWESALVASEALDGGYLAAGYSRSGISGDKTESNRGGSGDDYWIVKTDASGNLRWNKTLGGSGADQPYALLQTADSGYIIGGLSNSPVSGDKTEGSRGVNDFWILKLDTARNITWQRTLGGSGEDQLFSLFQTMDGGYITGGASASGISGERTEASNGGFDYWMLKLNLSGGIQWQKAFGGSGDDYLRVIRPTSDRGYILGGYSNSPVSGDKAEGTRGGSDFWIIKLAPCDTTVQVNDSFCIGDSYRLPGGSTVAAPGIYYDTLTNVRGCDSVVITTLDYYTDDIHMRAAGILGPDTVFCTGESRVLNAALAGAAGYVWSTGAISSSITVMQTDVYRVEITSVNGCVGRDTVSITFNSVPVVNLGIDTGICDHDVPLILAAPQPPGTHYLWSNGLSDTAMAVTRTGTYWLEASIGNCKGSDTIRITVTPAPDVHIGADTIICEQFPLRTGTEISGADYLWNTGAATPYIRVSTTGNYHLEVNLEGCIVRDTILVTAMPPPDIDLGEDGDICPEETIVLDGAYGSGSTYIWNTGSTSADISVTVPGLYWVQVTSEHQCIGSDSILLSYHPRPTVSLGIDTTVCEETPLRLSPRQTNAESLLWPDGSTGNTLDIKYGGTYIVTGINKCGAVSDTIEITQIFCDIWLPNAFTPNGDGVNDVFRVLGNTGRLEGFSLGVYNRWGQRIFHTNDKYQGWDGVYNGSGALLGTYVYVLEYNIAGKPYLQKGNFHLLR